MNEPHVEALYYRIETDPSEDYKKAEAVMEDTDAFRISVERGEEIVKCIMNKHFSTVKAARSVTDEYLKAWEVLAAIEDSPRTLRFAFDHADVIDRAPPPPDKGIVELKGSVHVVFSDHVEVSVSRGKYPNLPRRFQISPDVDAMYVRYEAFRQNPSTLTTMGFWCLKSLEESAGNRKEAARQYRISRNVLDRLGNLLHKGDEKEARKPREDKKYEPLTNAEKKWIEIVTKAIMRRAGEWAYDPKGNFKKLTMADFPRLNF